MRALPARPFARPARPCPAGKGGPEGKLRGRPPPPHCRAPDLGDGRGLNPSPDERKPAGPKYYPPCTRKTTRLKAINIVWPWFSATPSRLDSNDGIDGEESVAVRVGINGFGRIGRNFFRAHLQRGGDFEVVAANDLGDATTMAYLLKHDSVLGTLDEDVSAGDGAITVGGQTIQILAERDPGSLPWGDLGVDVVIESTGFFTKREGAEKHLEAGAQEGRHLRARDGPGRDDRPWRQRRCLRPRSAQHHLECLLHDELRRPAREGASRRVHDRAGVHDDDPRVHERPADPRSPAQGPAAGEGCCDQPDPDLDRRGPGDRNRDARPEGQGRRNVDARPGADRVDRRSRLPPRSRGDRRRDQRASTARRRTRARSRGSSSTRTSRWSRRTSSTRRTRRSSTAS